MAKDFWSDDDLDRPPDGDLDVLAVMEQELEDAAWRLETEHTLYLLSQGGDRLEAALRRLTNWELLSAQRRASRSRASRRIIPSLQGVAGRQLSPTRRARGRTLMRWWLRLVRAILQQAPYAVPHR